jgi:hypothetical protein
LNYLGKVELNDFVGGCIDGIEVDRVAGLEVRSEVDAIGWAYIDTCFVCELIVSLLDKGKFWRVSQDIFREAFGVDTEARILTVGASERRVLDSTDVVYSHYLGKGFACHDEDVENAGGRQIAQGQFELPDAL